MRASSSFDNRRMNLHLGKWPFDDREQTLMTSCPVPAPGRLGQVPKGPLTGIPVRKLEIGRLTGLEQVVWPEWPKSDRCAARTIDLPSLKREVDMETLRSSCTRRVPQNKGRLTGQKPPLKLREIWAIRTRLQMSSNVRELALFNLAIDSKLRACDLTRLPVQDICMGSHVVSRATFMRKKTQRPVQFEIT